MKKAAAAWQICLTGGQVTYHFSKANPFASLSGLDAKLQFRGVDDD